MKFNTQEARALGEALTALERGDGRAFDDRLWLGFGDLCGPVFERLARGKYIVASQEGVMATRITERGRALLERIGQQGLATG
ncbi:MAG: hypothetical protein IT436_14890 [Phycisphaerales bacterium]|nr:hypothetical protein [Phycisphaerales bacterium]